MPGQLPAPARPQSGPAAAQARSSRMYRRCMTLRTTSRRTVSTSAAAPRAAARPTTAAWPLAEVSSSGRPTSRPCVSVHIRNRSPACGGSSAAGTVPWWLLPSGAVHEATICVRCGLCRCAEGSAPDPVPAAARRPAGPPPPGRGTAPAAVRARPAAACRPPPGPRPCRRPEPPAGRTPARRTPPMPRRDLSAGAADCAANATHPWLSTRSGTPFASVCPAVQASRMPRQRAFRDARQSCHPIRCTKSRKPKPNSRTFPPHLSNAPTARPRCLVPAFPQSPSKVSFRGAGARSLQDADLVAHPHRAHPHRNQLPPEGQ